MKRSPLQRRTPLRSSGKRLRQTRSTTRPNKREAARFDALRFCQCLACLKNRKLGFGHTNMPCENHHLTDCGRRIGHMATIRLCHFHHQGKLLPGAYTSYSEAAKMFGPSLEREPASFRAMYGSDAELLVYQNELLEKDDDLTCN